MALKGCTCHTATAGANGLREALLARVITLSGEKHMVGGSHAQRRSKPWIHALAWTGTREFE
jgi:hypothetical protein